jgi:two-component system, chemotaxis family, chemotaxis protein CheY
MRSILREILRSIGVRTIKEAPDAIHAYELIQTNPIDIAFVDYAMPDMDGIEFTKKVRTSPDCPNVFLPIIMVSGHSEQGKVHAARDAGVNEFLVKPVTAKSLMARINMVVNHPRSFVKAPNYFGPDRRRRREKEFSGPWRRAEDSETENI